MKKRLCPTNQKGFTLIELISVMVIMGVMLSVAIKKFDLLSDSASINALKTGTRELNTRETLAWTTIKLSDGGWSDGSDVDVYNAVQAEILGPEYSWNSGGPAITGGTLYFKSQSVALTRTASSINSVGSWQ